ncbi:unnamed protein product [Ambrosiozyma monospora]|uniref:Unnamed protein product n=1 Tax=Ambrosiozyma monospora TaxID=43982 RepID=A0ACB5T5F6_AMBMO|nr:unnamed protein product [Ambrosiozyma monospora]
MRKTTSTQTQFPNSDVRSTSTNENTSVTRYDNAYSDSIYGDSRNKKRPTEIVVSKARVPKKRNRRTLVCSNCRRRKIKCDKQIPCHNCVKSHKAETCKYTTERNTDAEEDQTTGIRESTKRQRTGVSLLTEDHEEQLLQQQAEPVQRSFGKSDQTEVERLQLKINQLQALLNSANTTNRSTKSSRSPMNGFNGDSKTPDIRSPSNTSNILDMKLQALKPVTIIMENRNISYHGPLSHFRMTDSSHILIKRFISKRQQQKKKIQSPGSPYVAEKSASLRKLLNADIDEDDLIKRFELQLLPHYDALLSRIKYFGSYLNDLLYNGIFDMSMVVGLFHEFFTKTDVNSGTLRGYMNGSRFADLALVLCVIQSTFPFCDVDLSLASSVQLPKEIEIALSQLSIDALACSNIGVEFNYSALLSLVLMTDIHYSYSSHGDEILFEHLNSISKSGA